jgi:PAS domain S-box-containing protein
MPPKGDADQSGDPLTRWLDALRHVRWGVALSRSGDATLYDVNESFAAMHGFKRDELIGRPIADLVPAEDRGRLDASIARTEADEHLIYERHALRKDGSRFPVLVSVTSVADAAGTVGFRAAHVLDMSAVRESEAAFRFARFAMDRSADAVYLVDRETGEITYANSAAAALTGFSLDELVGAPIARIDPERAFEQPFERSGDETVIVEGTHRRKDGSALPVEMVATRIETGGKRYACIMARDLTERMRADANRRFTQFAIDTALDAAYWLDESGKVVYANEAAASSLGYQRGEMTGLSVSTFIPRYETADWGATVAMITRLKHTQFESTHRRKDGSTFPVEISANYIEVEGHSYLCGYARDITERRRMLNELSTSRARLDLLNRIATGIRSGMSVNDVLSYVVEQVAARFDDVGVSYGTLDSGRLTIDAYRGPASFAQLQGTSCELVAAERLVGALRRGETVVVRDRAADERVAPVDATLAPNIRALVAVPIAHDEGIVGVLSFTRSAPQDWGDHEVKTLQEVGAYLSIMIKEARTQEQRLTALAEIEAANARLIREVAERVRVEQEIRELNRTLESRVEHRTKELLVANHELEAFVYSVSHDLRAPVRAMGGFSKIVLDEHSAALDDQARSDLGRIVRAARRMELMIDDLLNLSRVSKRRLEPGPVDLSELAEATIHELRATAPERQVQVQITPGIVANGDTGLLGLLLENLLGNAWKFTRNTPEPRVEFGREERADGVVLYVRDNGAGFDMRYASKLFAPFQRLHPADQFEGTGVGLATVERVVRRHRGTIWAESTPDHGATFFFTLSDDLGD